MLPWIDEAETFSIIANDLTIALGSNAVKLYDMVVAYGAFANGGFRVRPYSVERVENSRGVVIYENPGPKIVKVISFDTAAGMTYMLRKVVEVGTGRIANISKAVAGKTGTTDDYRDAWFMGFTPDIVTGVWLGKDSNGKLPGITGGGLPAKVFADYMKVATTNFADSLFDYPKMNEEKEVEIISDVEEKPTTTEDEEVIGEDVQNNEQKEDEALPVQKPINVELPQAQTPSPSQKPFQNIEVPKVKQVEPMPQSAPLPGM